MVNIALHVGHLIDQFSLDLAKLNPGIQVLALDLNSHLLASEKIRYQSVLHHLDHFFYYSDALSSDPFQDLSQVLNAHALFQSISIDLRFVKIEVGEESLALFLTLESFLEKLEAGILQVSNSIQAHHDGDHPISEAIYRLNALGFCVHAIKPYDASSAYLSIYFFKKGLHYERIEQSLSLNCIEAYQSKNVWHLPFHRALTSSECLEYFIKSESSHGLERRVCLAINTIDQLFHDVLWFRKIIKKQMQFILYVLHWVRRQKQTQMVQAMMNFALLKRIRRRYLMLFQEKRLKENLSFSAYRYYQKIRKLHRKKTEYKKCV